MRLSTHKILCIDRIRRQAFWDGQEPNQNEGILVSSPEVVANIPNRHVYRMMFMLAGCDGNGSFIAPKNYRYENSPMCIWVSRYEVLLRKVSEQHEKKGKFTNTLPPSPVSRHEVAVLSLATHKLAIGDVVNPINKFRVREDVVDDLARVAIPDPILGSHPFRRRPILWTKAVVLGGVRLPRYVAKLDFINHGMKFVVINDWCQLVVGDQRSAPDPEELVDYVVQK